MFKKAKSVRRLLIMASVFITLPSIAHAQNIAAAQAAANSADCLAMLPFYWEVGDLHSGAPSLDDSNVIVSGNVGLVDGRNITWNIASAVKWIFAAYVLEKFGGVPSNARVDRALRMLSGYIHWNQDYCLLSQSVLGCYDAAATPYPDHGYEADADGSSFDPPNFDGPWYYSSMHDQYIGGVQTIGSTSIAGMSADELSQEIKTTLGLQDATSMKYQYPAIASGMEASAAEYAYFLQKIMHGDYAISSLLGANPVATQVVTGTPPNETATCPEGLSACSPLEGVGVHYSYGHVVEDNQSPGQIVLVPGLPPKVVTIGIGDGSYGAAGAWGFYGWISHDKNYYGVISRHGSPFGYQESWKCGQKIRKAFLDEQ